MSANAIEIFRCYDEWGMIRVLDDGLYRYLAFGDGGEQSCMQVNNTARLIHEYTQVMMLALVFIPEPKRATVIGVGAGSLINALQLYDAELPITGVELRPHVVDVAKDWFAFQPSNKVELCFTDAASYLYRVKQPTDILMIDIFDDNGLDDSLLDEDLMVDAYNALSAEGVLVLNLWDEGYGEHHQVLTGINKVFGFDVLAWPVTDGNLIIMAFKNGCPMTNSRYLQGPLKTLQQRIDIPARKLFQRVRRAI